MLINIKDKSGNLRHATPINQGSKRKFQLMKEDYITLKFSTELPIHFSLGDGIDNEIGVFELIDLYKPDYNTTTGGYDYELRLDAYYWKWKNKKFFFTPEKGGREAGWSLTATLDTHMKIFLKNLEILGYKFREQAFSYVVDDTVENSSKPLTFDNVNMIDALTQIAEAWQCEWWITDSVIHFGRCEYKNSVDFDIDVNVSEMSRSDSQTTYATRIYAFGSTKNIPSDYRPIDESIVANGVVQKRLMLPVGTPYVDADAEMSAEEIIEEIVVFEDVYPRRVGNMSGITTHQYTDKIEEEDKEPVYKKWNAYRFKDSGITFSKEYQIPGQDLKIIFQSGAMNGMTFTVVFNPCDKDKNETPQKEKNADGTWNPLAQVFEIIRNEDYGRPIPDESLKPADGDKYVLYGFKANFVADTMIPDAEKELLEKAKAYIEKSKQDPSTYTCKMRPEFIYNNGAILTFELGDQVNLINKAYFDEGRRSRIIGYECSLDIPYDHPVYTVGETASYSRLGEIENKVDSLTYKGNAFGSAGTGNSSGASVYVIGLNDNTLPSDRNTFSAKRVLNEMKVRAISRQNPDSAQGLITFLKGLTSKDLIEANNGLVIRKQELVEEPVLMSASLDSFSDTLVEESADVLIEELRVFSPGSATTLGELTNVTPGADSTSETDDLLVRIAGTEEWSIHSTLLSQVAQLMTKVFPFTSTLTGGGTYEKGSSQTVTLSWTYDREIESQSINGESLDITARSRQYPGVTTDTSYTLLAVNAGETYTKSVTAQFKTKKYYGTSADGSLTNAQILALPSTWATRAQPPAAFDCTGGKYPYYILPTSMASGIQFWIGGLRNTDWAEEIRNVTNAHGHRESYTIYKLNSIQTGVLNIEIK